MGDGGGLEVVEVPMSCAMEVPFFVLFFLGGG